MTEKEWAEVVSKAASQYVLPVEDNERKWYERVAFVAGASFALVKAGADSVELCNEFAHRCGEL